MGVDLKNRVRCFNDEFKAKVAEQKLSPRRVVRAINRVSYGSSKRENFVAVFEFKGAVLYSWIMYTKSEDFDLDELVERMEHDMRTFDDLLSPESRTEDRIDFIVYAFELKYWRELGETKIEDLDLIELISKRVVGMRDKEPSLSFLHVYNKCMENFFEDLSLKK